MVGSIFLSAFILLIVLLPIAGYIGRARNRKRDQLRGWRVRHQGRDMLRYEEFNDGDWQSIPIEGEMLCGKPGHVIYFDNAEKWLEYPDWARFRRDEIINRIKGECPMPDYEHDGA